MPASGREHAINDRRRKGVISDFRAAGESLRAPEEVCHVQFASFGHGCPADVDQRIAAYRDAAVALRLGKFPVHVPFEGSDEIASLGAEIKQLAEAIERKFREISELSRVTERVNAGLILDEVLDYVYVSFRSIIPYDRIGFSLLEDRGRVLRALWARSEAPVLRITRGYSAPMEGSSLQTVLESRRPRILNDLVVYLRAHPRSESTRLIVDEGVRSSLTCPLINDDKPIGFIFFSSFQPDTYKDVHVELFLQIAGQLAAIVEKSRLYKELLELNEAKNRFLGMAAHDLRSPIGIVQSFATLLREQTFGPLEARQKEILERMELSCGLMLQLIDDLLDVSAIEAGRVDLVPVETPLGAFLERVVDVNRMLAAGKAMELDLEMPPGLPAIAFDPRRIEQVINNLLSNAVKFSRPGTRVRIRARVEGERAVVSVADEGPGIPQAEADRLFHDFVRTSVRPTGGEKSTGLGLSIVRRLVTAHGGDAWVESRVGKGSTFSFSLPTHPV